MKRIIHIIIIVLLSSRAVAITNSEAIQLVNRYYQLLTNYASIDNDSPELARRISSMHIDNTGYIYPDIEIKLGGLPETKGVIISTYLTSLSDPERKRNMLLKFVPKEMNVKSNSGNICLISYTLYVYDDNVNPNTSVLKYSIPLEMSIYQSGKIKSIVKGTNTYTTAASSAKINKVWVEENIYENGKAGMRIHVNMNTYNLNSKQCQLAAYFYTESGTALIDTNGQYTTVKGNVSIGESFTPPYDNTLYEDFTLFMPYRELHISQDGNYMFHVILWNTSVSPIRELSRSAWTTFQYTFRK